MPDPALQLRAFVSITPPDEWVASFSQIQSTLGSLPWGRQIRWTNPVQMHLTLRFLGSISAAQAMEAEHHIEAACRGFAPFELELGDLGCFPDRRRPRILWVGLRGAVPILLSLQDSISRVMRSVGDHEDTRPFTPHLTLGRAKPTHRLREMTADPLFARPGPWRVESVQLMRSDLKPDGAVHSTLFRQPLGKDPPGLMNKDLQSPPNAL